MDHIVNKKIKHVGSNEDLTVFQALKGENSFTLEGERYECDTLWNLSYKQVVSIKNNIQNSHEIFDIIFDLKADQVKELRLKSFFSFLNFVYDQIEDITLREAELNTGKTSPLDKFGVLAIIDSLASEDVLKWNQIEELPYHMIISKLLIEKTKTEIQRNEHSKIKNHAK